MSAGSPSHRCAIPGCDKRALYAAPKTGKLKASDDHDLCKRHWQAAMDRMRPKRRRRNLPLLHEMRAIVAISAEVWATTPQMVVARTSEKGARQEHIALARTASAHLIRDLLEVHPDDIADILHRNPSHIRWMFRKADTHLIHDRHFISQYDRTKQRILAEVAL